MTAVWGCKLLGGVLLILTGTGVGWGQWGRCRQKLEEIRRFSALLVYLLDSVRYRALPAAAVLRMAAQNRAFAAMGLEQCRGFSSIPVPRALSSLAPDLQAGLYALERDPKDSACRTLEYLLARCRAAERRAQEEADRARVLFPRLGAALGLVSAILLL